MKSAVKSISKKIGVYNIVSTIQLRLKYLYNQLFRRYLNRYARQQESDLLSIPIIIISFNQYSYLKQLIDYLRYNGFKKIVIIDNKSTYSPLINYFKELDEVEEIELVRLNENYGHRVFWKAPDLFKKYGKGYYVLTDPDIIPLTNNAKDFMKIFMNTLNSSYKATKVGFSLKIDDIPDTNLNKKKIQEWENQWWLKPISPKLFEAHIDTTFALYRPSYHTKQGRFLKGIRTAPPLQAKHCSWYIDSNQLTEEQHFFMLHCNSSSSWRLNDDGIIEDRRYD